ncbi:hypothetical protein APUTEX25_004280 [Auxenochlorella protothecoides]|uniref:Uncharacterized protein n=1 Tax=Auxenochlorella protothecoides TaxID=3075 RepID=A0A3M7L7H5_AUXPR|nr:hypothetical protein APUTEX25_004280 [Auxenochlorella protothecoides]|eukprot:RMZ57446.1 hypothetical protein APUTEX25_004280 [Auxenochlorella protothecoides]
MVTPAGLASVSGPQVPEPALPRPPRKAWNKGRPMDPETRQLLSQGAAQRWKDPEYRAAVSSKLKEALRPWVSDFEARAGRKPTMQDVQAAGVPWLLERYRHYILLRQRLFHGAGTVRGSLDGGMVAGRPGGAPVPQQNPKTKATATDRLAAALEYRSRQAAAAGGLPGAVGAAGPAVGGRDEAAAAAEGPGPAPPAGLERGQGLGPGASTRVRSAMLAAMEYKAKREQGKA